MGRANAVHGQKTGRPEGFRNQAGLAALLLTHPAEREG